jgi:DNA-binding winged helix-turn-helix (wHTH) protein
MCEARPLAWESLQVLLGNSWNSLVRLRFDHLVLDSDARQLVDGMQEVRLSPKAYELLEVLIRSRPRALSKTQLQRHLWPEVAVAEGNLAGVVAELRAGLGDRARSPRYVRTVYGFGYAFCGEVEEETSSAAGFVGGVPRVIWEGRVVPLREGENVLGRDPDVLVRIDVPGVSRRHARIMLQGTCAMLEDLDSKNGSAIGDVELAPGAPASLADGARFRLGRVSLTYRSAPETGSTVTDPKS